MKVNVCEECKHYEQLLGMYGICDKDPNCKAQVHKYDLCAAFKHRTSKVKPRRLCDFCELKRSIGSFEEEHIMRLVKCTPLPAINLTTGEKSNQCAPPYYAVDIFEDGETAEKASFQIKYCPVCGRKLESEK